MSDEKITFRQLRDILNNFTEDQLDCDATAFCNDSGECHKIYEVEFQEEDGAALKKGHPFLLLPYA